MALLAGVRVQAPEAHMVTRVALAAVLLWQAIIAVSLLPQREPETVPPAPDTSWTRMLLPDDSPPPPAGRSCLPIMNRMGWDGCPVVLR